LNLSGAIVELPAQDIVLKTLTPENMSKDYVAWLNDPEVVQFLEVRHQQEYKTQESIVAFVSSVLQANDSVLFGIFLKDDGRHIGNIKLGFVSPHYHRADIGLMIGDKNSWGKGYATQAIRAVCIYGFDILKLRKIYAGAYAHNIGSIKAFEKLGFQREGIQRKHWEYNGQAEDGISLGLLAEERTF
jgi:ribosomal-protein-alanine N-acetyltransferase